MARRRRHSPTPSPPRVTPYQKVIRLQTQMRGLIQAARAPRARRFVTPTQVQERINALTRSIYHEYHPNAKRQTTQGQTVVTTPSGRQQTRQSEVLRERLPVPVRDVLRDAKRALVCTRRDARREVMHALQRTGKGGRKNQKAKWTDESYISCKRG